MLQVVVAVGTEEEVVEEEAEEVEEAEESRVVFSTKLSIAPQDSRSLRPGISFLLPSSWR